MECCTPCSFRKAVEGYPHSKTLARRSGAAAWSARVWSAAALCSFRKAVEGYPQSKTLARVRGQRRGPTGYGVPPLQLSQSARGLPALQDAGAMLNDAPALGRLFAETYSTQG